MRERREDQRRRQEKDLRLEGGECSVINGIHANRSSGYLMLILKGIVFHICQKYT